MIDYAPDQKGSCPVCGEWEPLVPGPDGRYICRACLPAVTPRPHLAVYDATEPRKVLRHSEP